MLSVVIPARNAAAWLPSQLDALAGQTYQGEWEVVVADNSSTDRTRQVAQEAAARLPNLRIVDAFDRRGSNYARNTGAAAALGEFVLFVDADDVVTPTWLAAMARAAGRCDAVGGVLDRTGFTPPSNSLAGRERTSGLQTWPGFLPYPSGANCGLRTDLLRAFGGFDASYSCGGDDVELFWRLQLAGHEVCFVPDAVVVYRERATLRSLARQFYLYGTQDPHLFRDFRAAGMPGSGAGTGLRAWAHLALLAPWYWWHPGRRRQWVRSTARRVGRLVGSARHTTPYF